MISASKLLSEHTPNNISATLSKSLSGFFRNIMSVNMDFDQPRLVSKKVLARPQSEGEGAVVRRSIGRPELKSLDPFLMLDEFSVSPPAGFPDHPHRGFETVTYVLQGGITHQDFAGHKGTIHAGEVQWMTAGRGIVHSEMPAGEGTHTGLQLWINLSSKDKMQVSLSYYSICFKRSCYNIQRLNSEVTFNKSIFIQVSYCFCRIEPRYQELLRDEIPKAEKDGVEVRVIAGESMGVESPVYTRTPTMYLDFTLKPSSQHHQKIPEPWNAFAYIIEGEGVFGTPNSPPVSAHHIAVLGSGEGLCVWNKSSEPLRFIFVGGEPLNEPVVQQGPFVMNTQAEINKAMEDYYYGKNGFEMAKNWRSK